MHDQTISEDMDILLYTYWSGSSLLSAPLQGVICQAGILGNYSMTSRFELRTWAIEEIINNVTLSAP